MKSALVTIAKNEELYLRDWITYHSCLGFDEIYVVDNSDEGVTTQFNLCNYYSKIYPVKCIYCCGRETLKNMGLQQGVYKNVYNYIKENSKDIDWIAYIDVDEYLYLDGMSINNFLCQDKFKYVDLIHVNWKCYGDNDLVNYEPRPVTERFTKPLPIDAMYNNQFIGKDIFVNMHVKSIVRVNDKEPVFDSVHTFHYDKDIKGNCVNVAGEPVDCRLSYQAICYNGGHIKHFVTKSTEEFIERRLKDNPRIDGDFNRDKTVEIESYFNINTKTYSKIKLIEQKTGIKL